MKYSAVSKQLFNLLKKLLSMDLCGKFVFGGGSSLALRFGHRTSVDIDLFTTEPFNSEETLQSLAIEFPNLEIINRTSGSLCLAIDGIKLDFLLHAYPLIGEIEIIDEIRFLSREDIAAMKINAVTGRGSRKDFADLLCLHEQGVTLEMSLAFYEKKYGHAGKFLALRSLAWFGDADAEPELSYLNGWTWPDVRKRMKGLTSSLIEKNK